MTSTTETETKVETQTPAAAAKEENLPVANDAGGDAAKDGEKPAENASAPGSPTKKTGTLKNVVTAHKKDFEKDVVYLYQFVRSPTTPSLSACCLMVETWLRMSGIQYEVSHLCLGVVVVVLVAADAAVVPGLAAHHWALVNPLFNPLARPFLNLSSFAPFLSLSKHARSHGR